MRRLLRRAVVYTAIAPKNSIIFGFKAQMGTGRSFSRSSRFKPSEDWAAKHAQYSAGEANCSEVCVMSPARNATGEREKRGRNAVLFWVPEVREQSGNWFKRRAGDSSCKKSTRIELKNS
jgi:hypothetical protein